MEFKYIRNGRIGIFSMTTSHAMDHRRMLVYPLYSWYLSMPVILMCIITFQMEDCRCVVHNSRPLYCYNYLMPNSSKYTANVTVSNILILANTTSKHPTPQPTDNPTDPTLNPTNNPTASPTTAQPTTSNPTKSPTKNPSTVPSAGIEAICILSAINGTDYNQRDIMRSLFKCTAPTKNPSFEPTWNPTSAPTAVPSNDPTVPTTDPTAFCMSTNLSLSSSFHLQSFNKSLLLLQVFA